MYSGFRNFQMAFYVSFTIFPLVEAPLMKLYESTVKLEPIAKYRKQISTKNIVRFYVENGKICTTNQNDQ
jgi:hypothetical protein